MASSSDEAQYLPSRYSRTKTGTLAPTLTLRTRSLRTTVPAKRRLTLSSSASRVAAWLLLTSDPQFHRYLIRLIEDRVRGRILHDDPDLLAVIACQHEPHAGLGAGLDMHDAGRPVEVSADHHAGLAHLFMARDEDDAARHWLGLKQVSHR